MNREYADFFRDMLENAQRAIQFTEGMDYESFSKDEKTVYAVIRAVEIIGEAAANIPAKVHSEYPGIPWREIKGMRNKLVHHYFGVNMEVVWQTINEDLPMLIKELKSIPIEAQE
ncbi:MAG: DUF86 domain-containing protein [Chloroflexota bacterium]